MGKHSKYSWLRMGMIALTGGVVFLGIAGEAAPAATCETVSCAGKDAPQCLAALKDHNQRHLRAARGMPESTALNQINRQTDAKKQADARADWALVTSGIAAIKKGEDDAEADANKGKKLDDTKLAELTDRACKTEGSFNSFTNNAPPALPPVTPPAVDGGADGAAGDAGVAPPPAEPGKFDNKKELCEQKCKAPDAYCIDVETGQSFCKDVPGLQGDYEPPGKLREGLSWIVRVAGKDEEPAPDFDLKVGEIKSADQLFASPPAAAAPAGKKGPAAAPMFMILKEVTAVAPTSADVTSLEVLFTRKDKTGTPRRFEVPVDHGKHYLDVGVMIPLVFSGKREIVQTPIPGTGGEKRLSLQSELDVSPALVLTVYPFGRRRGLWSAFQRPGAETVSDLFGLQFGVDVDLKNAFDRIYAGVSLMPIAGLGIGVGAAFVKGDFFPAGYSDGILLPKGETFTPNREYMIQPYLGFTLSTEILTSLAAVKSPF